MNPSSRETPGISLPPPVAEKALAEVPSQGSPEQGVSAPETAQRPGVAQPAMSLPAMPAPITPPARQNATQTDAASTTTSTSSPVLDDSDKVEKEWVNKARRIVEQTRHDPYRQSEELTVVKADYMKQRYNKIIKVDK